MEDKTSSPAAKADVGNKKDSTTSPNQSQGENSESRKLDTDYMSAVESGDMETVQSMVDEAA